MKKSRVDAKKIGPLKLAALNGLSLSRLPLPDEGKDVPARATNDERVRMQHVGCVPALGQCINAAELGPESLGNFLAPWIILKEC